MSDSRLAPPARPADPRSSGQTDESAALRPDLACIADWIPHGSRVLDLGCGDGALLSHLQTRQGCSGYGVEIDDSRVLACVRRGVAVIQQDIEAGLGMFAAAAFDVAVLSMALQATHQTEKVLTEMSAIAQTGIVSIPNFGHWFHIWSLARGRMPVSREMPYQWYNTPNLHLATVRDFEEFLTRLGLRIQRRAFLADGRPVRRWAAFRATQAIYSFCRDDKA
jgi:methionine biosynthesis protein MetW